MARDPKLEAEYQAGLMQLLMGQDPGFSQRTNTGMEVDLLPEYREYQDRAGAKKALPYQQWRQRKLAAQANRKPTWAQAQIRPATLLGIVPGAGTPAVPGLGIEDFPAPPKPAGRRFVPDVGLQPADPITMMEEEMLRGRRKP